MGIVSRLQSWANWFMSDPAGFLIYLLYFAASILLTLMLHEIAHGYVAWKCGDPTAKMLGRLSMDPRKHLDPLGTIFLIFFGRITEIKVGIHIIIFQCFRKIAITEQAVEF